MPKPLDRLDVLFRPVSPASLGLFRIAFGLIMAVQLEILRPYITETLAQSKFFLTYDGFHWVRILPQPYLRALFAALLVAALSVAAGFRYRIAIVTLWVGWTYVFLLCRGHYTNHYYLFSLLAFLLIFCNADRRASVDRLLARRRRASPAAGDFVPYWQISVLRLQVALVYFFGGVAKLDHDWLRGFPMKIWLAQRTDTPWIGAWLDNDVVAYALSYGGVVFDLVVPFLLLGKRTRVWALPPLLFFHLSNHLLWNIGVFPWFMLVATLLFFEPDWPERALARLGFEASMRRPPQQALRSARVAAALGVYLLVQALLPLRHFLYPGNPSWHGQGDLFAWRMLLYDQADAVRVRVDVPGEGTVGYVELDKYINRTQFVRMVHMPTAYVRFAHFLREEAARNSGIERIEVYVDVRRSLNARPFRHVIDPELDLASVEYRSFAVADYILPLDPLLQPGTGEAWQEGETEAVSPGSPNVE